MSTSFWAFSHWAENETTLPLVWEWDYTLIWISHFFLGRGSLCLGGFFGLLSPPCGPYWEWEVTLYLLLFWLLCVCVYMCAYVSKNATKCTYMHKHMHEWADVHQHKQTWVANRHIYVHICSHSKFDIIDPPNQSHRSSYNYTEHRMVGHRCFWLQAFILKFDMPHVPHMSSGETAWVSDCMEYANMHEYSRSMT